MVFLFRSITLTRPNPTTRNFEPQGSTSHGIPFHNEKTARPRQLRNLRCAAAPPFFTISSNPSDIPS